MRSLRSIVGLPVRLPAAAEPLGVVSGVCVDPGTVRLAAVLIARPGLVRLVQMAYWQDLDGAGPDALVIGRPEQLLPLDEVAPGWWSTHREPGIWGRPLYARDGRQVGLIGDLLVDAKGRVVGCEVSDGVLADLVAGRRALLAEVGPDASGQGLVLLSEPRPLPEA